MEHDVLLGQHSNIIILAPLIHVGPVKTRALVQLPNSKLAPARKDF